MKDSIQQIVRDTKSLLDFHQSLGIGSYPLSEGVRKLLRSPAKATTARRRVTATFAKQERVPPTTPRSRPATGSLDDIKTELGDCTRCALYKERCAILFGAGAEKASLFIVGEWPSISDEQAGELFSDAEGEMLDKMLTHVLKLSREEIYIASIIKCRAPGTTSPTRQQIETCLPFISRQIEVVNPDIICTMGPLAAQTLLRSNKPLIRLRAHFHDYKGIPLMPTFHPSFLLKNPEMKKAALIDLQMIAKRLAKTT